MTLGDFSSSRDLQDRRETVIYVQYANESRGHEMELPGLQSGDNRGPFVFLAVKTASRVPHTHRRTSRSTKVRISQYQLLQRYYVVRLGASSHG